MGRNGHSQGSRHRPGVVFITADGRGVGPGLAVNVGAASVPRAARPDAGGSGTQMRRAGQLRVGTDVADPVGGHGRGATIVERAGRVIVAPIGVHVEIDDAVVQRAAEGPAANTGNIVAIEVIVTVGRVAR